MDKEVVRGGVISPFGTEVGVVAREAPEAPARRLAKSRAPSRDRTVVTIPRWRLIGMVRGPITTARASSRSGGNVFEKEMADGSATDVHFRPLVVGSEPGR